MRRCWGRWLVGCTVGVALVTATPVSARLAHVRSTVRQCELTLAGHSFGGSSRRQHLVAYNLSCRLADRYWVRLPSNWVGANVDDSDGGHGDIYPDGDQNILFHATRRDGTLISVRLHGTPVVWQRQFYGE
jgi:hypothetical protein